MHSMDKASKQALANAYKMIVALHEGSYDRARGRYTMSYEQAKEQLVAQGKIDRDTAELAKPMAGSEYGEFSDWANRQ